MKAEFTPRVRDRIAAKLKQPTRATTFIDGTLEMVDFKPGEHKCRIMPALGQAVICSFTDDQEERIQEFLRKPVRLTGEATRAPHTDRIELRVQGIEPIPSFAVGAGEFSKPPNLQDLAANQGIRPLSDPGTLRGVFSQGDNLDEMLDEIYRERT